jgi:hypothetical protein
MHESSWMLGTKIKTSNFTFVWCDTPTIHARWLPLLKVEILLNGKKNDQPKF